MRFEGRALDAIRKVTIETDVTKYAEGSCLITIGNTMVLCTASIDETVPSFLKGRNKGWITAEYSMLPRATHKRNKREASQGNQTGRTHEIQRLIARSLRSVIDVQALGERQIIVDCDVLQADGGTRTASITGGYVATYLACQSLLKNRLISRSPITSEVAAISCGIIDGESYLDLDYQEDSSAEVDANFIINNFGTIVEIQATAEKTAFTASQLNEMLTLANKGVKELIELQQRAIKRLKNV